MKGFEAYLAEIHAEQYIGAKDMMIDDLTDWLQDLDIEEWIEYGDKFAQELLGRK